MTGFPLIIAFIVAIVFMIVAISKFKIHPFLIDYGCFFDSGIGGRNSAGRPDRIGRNCYQWSGNSDWSRIFRYIHQYWHRYYSWSINRKHSGRDRSCIETCRHGHPSGWKKPSGVGYGTDGMGCFHSGIL